MRTMNPPLRVVQLEWSLIWLNEFVSKDYCPFGVQQEHVGAFCVHKNNSWANDIAVVINRERWRNMTTDSWWQKWNDVDLDDMSFKQRGATCHTFRDKINFQWSCNLQKCLYIWACQWDHAIRYNSAELFTLGLCWSIGLLRSPLLTTIIRVIDEIKPDLCGKVFVQVFRYR